MEEVGRERVGGIGIDRAPPAGGEQDLSPHFACLQKQRAEMTLVSTACRGRAGLARVQAKRHMPNVGSSGGAVSYERGNPVG